MGKTRPAVTALFSLLEKYSRAYKITPGSLPYQTAVYLAALTPVPRKPPKMATVAPSCLLWHVITRNLKQNVLVASGRPRPQFVNRTLSALKEPSVGARSVCSTRKLDKSAAGSHSDRNDASQAFLALNQRTPPLLIFQANAVAQKTLTVAQNPSVGTSNASLTAKLENPAADSREPHSDVTPLSLASLIPNKPASLIFRALAP